MKLQKSKATLATQLLLLVVLIFSSTATANTTPAVPEHDTARNFDIFSTISNTLATRTSTAVKEEKTNPKDHQVYGSGSGRLGMEGKTVLWVGILVGVGFMVVV
jgi:hypothetical protein